MTDRTRMSALVTILSALPGLALTSRLRPKGAAIWWSFGLGWVALGVVFGLGGLLLERRGPGLVGPLEQSFLWAAIPEETAKLLGLLLVARKHPQSVLRLSVALSLGFASAESIVFALRGGVQSALVHTLFAVPAHAAFGAIMGRFLSADRPPALAILSAWAAAVTVHGIYDWPLFTIAAGAGSALIVSLWAGLVFNLMRWTWIQVRYTGEDVIPIPEPRSTLPSVPPPPAPRPGTRALRN
ncbi:MAG: PrsW family glutamic-type intramembrane protease [Planctomycetota bacterium]